MPRTKQFCEIETLEKAVELFWNKGFHATSMQDLVSHLGINRASLYGTYGDKHGLFKKALYAYSKSNREFLGKLLSEESDLIPGLRKLFTFTTQTPQNFSSSPGCLMVNTAIEMLPNEPQYQEVIDQNREKMMGILKEFIGRERTGMHVLPPEEVQRLAYLTYTFQNGLQVIAKSESDSSKIEALIDDFLKVFD